MNPKTSTKIHNLIKSQGFRTFIRLGYIIRGMLYGFVGLITLTVAGGFREKTINTVDVITLIKEFYFGNFLLIIVIAGLIGYSIWGLIRAFIDIIDPTNRKIHLFQRIGYLISAISYASLVIATLSLILHLHDIDSDRAMIDTIDKIIAIPYGNVVIIIVGIASMIGGCMQVIKAVSAKRPIDFWSTEDRKKYSIPFMIFAKVGISVRGLIFIMIGYFITIAGFHANAAEVKGLDTILSGLKHVDGGPIMLICVGIGLLFFGMYSVLLSIWVDLP